MGAMWDDARFEVDDESEEGFKTPTPPLIQDCTDGRLNFEVVSQKPTVFGDSETVSWCPVYGTVHIETHNGKSICVKTPELAQKEFCKSRLRKLIDRVLDMLHL